LKLENYCGRSVFQSHSYFLLIALIFVDMASYLKSLSPVPSFPEYTGPHKVGTIDVEIPVSELDGPSPPPEDAADTVLFRVFYPCEVESKTSKHISWFPSPQRGHVSAYTRFLGAGSRLAEFIS
jgi:platelet-activating factor acetylhydrolase